MSDPTAPALSAEEWAKREFAEGDISFDATMGRFTVVMDTWSDYGSTDRDVKRLPALIALANAALPDTDPRKITREMVAQLRRAADLMCEAKWGVLEPEGNTVARIADALASYLPPEAP